MIILGIDPGTVVTGYSVIECNGRSASTFALIEFGVIKAKKLDAIPKRLALIYSRLAQVIDRTTPDECAIETAFSDKNVQSALKLGQARGVAVVAAELAGLKIAEYAPRAIKKAVTGNGNASKEQVEFMVGKLLTIPEHERTLSDAYDAIAVAITHALKRNDLGSSATNWKQFINANPDRVKKSK